MCDKGIAEYTKKLLSLVRELDDEEFFDLQHFIDILQKEGSAAAWKWALSKCKPKPDPDIQHD